MDQRHREPVIPFLPGDNSCVAAGITRDGLIIVGHSYDRFVDASQACRWTSGGAAVTGLGDLPGGDFDSSATAISADGGFIAGTGHSSQGAEAFALARRRGPVPARTWNPGSPAWGQPAAWA